MIDQSSYNFVVIFASNVILFLSLRIIVVMKMAENGGLKRNYSGILM